MSFLDQNFLLSGATARHLYKNFAETEPILDFHCHLPPKDIAENREFANLFEIWLEGDHYKWRAMRACGEAERVCTGDAPPYEKFLAWARTVPYTLRNPLYHWTHLELKRYFGIDVLLDERTAPAIWEEANRVLRSGLTAHAILRKFNVRAICTVDDPADTLDWHKKIAASDLSTAVLPTFRPDRAFQVTAVPQWNEWVHRLGREANLDIRTFRNFLAALSTRHDHFHVIGCRLSDHGLDSCFPGNPSEAAVAPVFEKLRAGKEVNEAERLAFGAYLMLFFGKLDAEKGWTKQIHLGARRNNNTRMYRKLGADTGFDSIGDFPQIDTLGAYLNYLEEEEKLPRMILYNNNPTQNYTFATMAGNFQGSGIRGKIQFGSGWWYLDQKEAIEWQINALSNCGLLSNFVGMLTDSRSFMSYPRHEYFRRVLCNLVGTDIEKGELPDDDALNGRMVKDICFGNAQRFLNLPARQLAGVSA